MMSVMDICGVIDGGGGGGGAQGGGGGGGGGMAGGPIPGATGAPINTVIIVIRCVHFIFAFVNKLTNMKIQRLKRLCCTS